MSHSSGSPLCAPAAVGRDRYWQIPSLPTAPLLFLPAAWPRVLLPVWLYWDNPVGAEQLRHDVVLPGSLPSPLRGRDGATAIAALLAFSFFSAALAKLSV